MENTNYIAYHFIVQQKEPVVDIIIAELGNAGFESFVETDVGVSAYIPKKDWNKNILNNVQILKSTEFTIHFTSEEIEQTNWNEKWEESFNSIVVNEVCTVRAPFHKKSNTLFDIIIEPKMSFGTGHHETTHMMIQHILKNEIKDKSVLDMGCGTGVLAILSEKKGASTVDAIDNDKWCYLNSIENVERNACERITVHYGDSRLIKKKNFDIILANINRNILINDIAAYVKCLNDKGILVLSGFYSDDILIIESECKRHGLKLDEIIEMNNWVSLKFIY